MDAHDGAAHPETLVLMIGTYSAKGGQGLYPLTYRTADDWAVASPIKAAQNTSGGAFAPRFDLHYLVNEAPQGGVGSHRSEGWRRMAYAETGGSEPCHAAVDESQARLAVANYGSGSVALFELDAETGYALEPPLVHALIGSGPNAERQTGPHAHWVGFAPNDGQLYVVDLGADEIRILTSRAGALEARLAFAAPAGSGPRQLLFHPTLAVAYLVSELSSTLTVLDRAADGGLAVRHMLSTLPDGYAGQSLGGHIALNAAGDRLYVTNRGHDSVAVFAVDAAGDVALMQHAFSGGVSPRFMTLLPQLERMVVAHEESGTVTVLEVDAGGRLAPPKVSLPVPGAVFIFPSSPQAGDDAQEGLQP